MLLMCSMLALGRGEVTDLLLLLAVLLLPCAIAWSLGCAVFVIPAAIDLVAHRLSKPQHDWTITFRVMVGTCVFVVQSLFLLICTAGPFLLLR